MDNFAERAKDIFRPCPMVIEMDYGDAPCALTAGHDGGCIPVRLQERLVRAALRLAESMDAHDRLWMDTRGGTLEAVWRDLRAYQAVKKDALAAKGGKP